MFRNAQWRYGGDKANIQQQRQNLALKQAARQLTFRRAALVAISSLEQTMQGISNMKRFLRMNTQLLHLQAASMMAEIDFFDALQDIEKKDKEYIVMKLIDRDGDGKISLRELAIAFQKMDPTKDFIKSVEDANTAIQKLGKQEDGKMNREEFRDFMIDMMSALECSFDDLCSVMIQWLAFNDSGHDIIQDAMDDNAISHYYGKGNDKDFEDEVTEIRTALLFQCLDYNGRGKILGLDVFERIFEIANIMNKSTRQLLFMMDGKEKLRELDYREFTNLVLNVTASCPPEIHFHDVADAITAACIEKIGGGGPSQKILALLADIQKETNFDVIVGQKLWEEKGISKLAYGRIHYLFGLIDRDGSGFIEAAELVTSIRKFQGVSEEIDQIIEDSVTKIAHVNTCADGRVSLDEYANFLCRLASSLSTDVNDIVSFLAVELSLRNDDAAGNAYVSKMKKRVLRKIKLQKGSSRSSWKFLDGLASEAA